MKLKLLILIVAAFLLAGCGGSSSQSSEQSTRGAASAAQSTPGTLQCKDCVDAGMMTANIFATAEMNSLACKEAWGTAVTILAESTKNDVQVLNVRTPSCTGWVSGRLVQR